MKYLVGKKLAMAQVFAASGEVTPVTYVEVTPHSVLSIQTDSAGQPVVLVLSKDKTKANKPQSIAYPELKDGGTITQVPIKSGETPAVGDSWDASAFQVGDLVMAAGVSKGRGFQGVVKRHGFHGHPTTHGHKDQVRKSGSIGAGGVQRVFKGMRMAGRMGNDKVSVKNLVVMAVDVEKNLLAIKGALPGARGGQIILTPFGGNVWLN